MNMFREMRRSRQSLPEADARTILECGSFGVLACAGNDGFPYAVPLSYAVEGDHIYFHCAMEGHKLDAIRREPRVSFCVVGRDEPQSGEYTTHYESAIAFGRAQIVSDADEKRRALMCISRKYEPGHDERSREKIEAALDRTAIVDIHIEHLTGKRAKGLLKRDGT